MSETYDLIVIGSGPGGYVSAIRASQLGKSVAIVEKHKTGGTCLNVGCIPSKTLLEYGTQLHELHVVNDWGIETSEVHVNMKKLMKRKHNIVTTLTNGVRQLLKKNKVTYIEGEATIDKDLNVYVGNDTYHAKDIILATGSRPFVPPINGLEQVTYDTTDTFFNLETLPESLAVIGGGVIATELASSMADLGVQVTIVEVADDILLTEIEEVRELLKQHLDSQGIKVITQAQIENVSQGLIKLKGQDDVQFDRLLVATG